MAFFKFRKGNDEAAPAAAQPQSIAAMRKRAMHRLVGATALVLAAVIGFPLVFDSQPRPIPVDIPIEIPDKNKIKPLAMPANPAATATPEPVKPPAEEILESKVAEVPVNKAQSATKKITIEEPEVKATAKPDAKAEAKPEPKPEPKAEVKPAPGVDAKVVAKADPKPDAKPEPKADESAKVQALLEGKSAAAGPVGAGESRFVVQVGAFADVSRAKEARSKVEKAGLKTYTQVVETKDGQRTRVRVGPFADRAEADKAAQKIKSLDLAATVLTL